MTKTRARLRCCGRFGYWSPPVGPWRCSKCYRELGTGMDMPANAGDRLLAAAELAASRLKPWGEAERAFVRKCFGPLITTFEGEAAP